MNGLEPSLYFSGLLSFERSVYVIRWWAGCYVTSGIPSFTSAPDVV